MRARRKRETDRGASIVEFAIVLPVLILLIGGIIDFGMTFNDYQSLRSGVRDGTRDAVVTNFGTDTACHDASQGGNPTGTALQIICRVKSRAGLGNNIRVGLWAPAGWAQGNTLRVCAQVLARSLTGITGPMLNGRVMTAKVEMRIEQALQQGVTFTEAQESALSASWPSTCSTGS